VQTSDHQMKLSFIFESLLKTLDHHTLSGQSKLFMVISVIQVWGKLSKVGKH